MRSLSRCAFIATLLIPAAVLAAPTAAEVDRARGECHRHKIQVEARGSLASEEQMRAWESACARASRMMDELAGSSPPQASEAAALEAGPEAAPPATGP